MSTVKLMPTIEQQKKNKEIIFNGWLKEMKDFHESGETDYDAWRRKRATIKLSDTWK